MRRNSIAYWPELTPIIGFELHHGISQVIQGQEGTIQPIMEDPTLGWISIKNNQRKIGGTYLHGIFENGIWRRSWLNNIRKQKGLPDLPKDNQHHSKKRENLIDLLADSFQRHVDLSALLKQ